MTNNHEVVEAGVTGLGVAVSAAPGEVAGKRPIKDTVQRLHEFLVLKGLSHEVASGRIGTPRTSPSFWTKSNRSIESHLKA